MLTLVLHPFLEKKLFLCLNVNLVLMEFAYIHEQHSLNKDVWHMHGVSGKDLGPGEVKMVCLRSC